MQRIFVIAAAALIATGSTAVLATAHDRAGPQGSGAGPATMIFERFDLDGNGEVTRDEVTQAAAQHFAEADTNGDGQLSPEELAAQAESRQEERRASRMAQRSERMLERHDANGDGLLSLEEMTAQDGEDRLERLFAHLDVDEDGVINKAEAERMAGERVHRGMGKRLDRGHERGHGRN